MPFSMHRAHCGRCSSHFFFCFQGLDVKTYSSLATKTDEAKIVTKTCVLCPCYICAGDFVRLTVHCKRSRPRRSSDRHTKMCNLKAYARIISYMSIAVQGSFAAQIRGWLRGKCALRIRAIRAITLSVYKTNLLESAFSAPWAVRASYTETYSLLNQTDILLSEY